MLSAPSSEARLHEACQLHCPEARLFARFNMAIMVRLIEDLSHGAMCFAFINLLFFIQRYLPYFLHTRSGFLARPRKFAKCGAAQRHSFLHLCAVACRVCTTLLLGARLRLLYAPARTANSKSANDRGTQITRLQASLYSCIRFGTHSTAFLVPIVHLKHQLESTAPNLARLLLASRLRGGAVSTISSSDSGLCCSDVKPAFHCFSGNSAHNA